jgi:hypothetical protein
MRFMPLLFVFAIVVSFVPFTRVQAATVTRIIAFPTDVTLELHNDFGTPRSGHTHEGNDILGKKMTPLYAAVDGVVTSAPFSQPRWGYEIVLQDAEGYAYHYIHVNNDTPGTDDGNGGVAYAYAPGIRSGAVVTKGQLIGWMGDSGTAETITSHLHFEIRTPDGSAIDPFPSLDTAQKAQAATPSPLAHTPATTTEDINRNQNFVATGSPAPCLSGSLIKGASSAAVYYCGADGKRHGFPNERVYFTWYPDFKQVKRVTDMELAAIPLGKNVIYRPGIRLVKVESIPKVYAVHSGGVLRWLPSPEIAVSLYGATWTKKVDDLSDALFIDYLIGESMTVNR